MDTAAPLPHLVDVDWLRDHHGEPGLVVVDASIALGGVRDVGIPGAVRFDIDGAMSRHDTSGSHDMLAPADFERELRALGLCVGDRVVAYDASGVFSAPRAWWMLRAAGIEAAVLDGGLPAWEAAGGPLEPVRENLGGEGDVVVTWDGTVFTDADVVAAALDEGAPVLDARSAARFAGTAPEPRAGLRSGHMPGAASVPFASLQADGRLLPVGGLRERLQEAAGDAPIIATCGSGVSACVIALAATLTDREVRVYDGSWAEWGREDSGRPVVTGDA